SAMIGHTRMAELMHAMESVFGMVREGKLTPTSDIVDALLAGVDGLQTLRDEVVSKQQSDVELAPTVEALHHVVEAGGGTMARLPGQAAPAGAPAAAAAAAPSGGTMLE